MTPNTSALTDMAALLLFQNIRDGLQNGRIANLNAAEAEVDAAIAQLNSKCLPEEPTLTGRLLGEIGSLHEKVNKCEEQLADFQHQAKVLKEDTAQIVARTEACGFIVEQQQKENAKVFAAMEEMRSCVPTTPFPPCVAPAPSPIDPIFRPSPSRTALVSFPGGPRTITIHPPDSPGYQSTIRDEKGNIIIDFRRSQPLRREGAFRGPLESIDWVEITRVCGRGADQPGSRAALPPSPRWPDRSQLSPLPPPSRSPSELVARQRQLSTSMQTDAFGRVLPPEYLSSAKSPGIFSSQESHSLSSENVDRASSSPSTPPSPTEGRGRKRSQNDDVDDQAVPPMCEQISLLTELRSAKQPITPVPVKREESRPPCGPSKRKKVRLTVSSEGLSTGGETHSFLDPTRPV